MISYLLVLDGIAFVVLGMLFFWITSSLVIYTPVVTTNAITGANTLTLNTTTGAGQLQVFPIYYLFDIIIAALALALFNPFFLLLTGGYKFNQNDNVRVKNEKLRHFNYIGYQISKKFYVTVSLFPIALSVLFTLIILPSGLTTYEIIAIFAVPIAVLVAFASYLHRRMQTDIYEDGLFKLRKFRINISVVTRQHDSVSGRIESIGSFLILRTTKGLHAIKWIDIERISLSR